MLFLVLSEAVHEKHVLVFKNVTQVWKNRNVWRKIEQTVNISTGLELRVFVCLLQVDVLDVTKTAEAFLKISSVYKEDNEEVKSAVLESIGEMNTHHMVVE